MHKTGSGSEDERISNYERTKREAQGLFLNYDQGEMLRKFSLEADGDYIYVPFVGRRYRIHRRSGLMERLDGAGGYKSAEPDAAMTIYDILCCSAPDCRVSGEFLPMKNLSAVYTSRSEVGKAMFWQEEKFFDTREPELRRACEALGGVPAGRGDVSYRIPVFGQLELQLQFWHSDEEFPASLQIFCDKNTLSFMHYETAWFMAVHVVARLMELAQG